MFRMIPVSPIWHVPLIRPKGFVLMLILVAHPSIRAKCARHWPCDGLPLCSEIDIFPNATIAEYGTYKANDDDQHDDDIVRVIMAEIYARAPVAALVNARPIHDY